LQQLEQFICGVRGSLHIPQTALAARRFDSRSDLHGDLATATSRELTGRSPPYGWKATAAIWRSADTRSSWIDSFFPVQPGPLAVLRVLAQHAGRASVHVGPSEGSLGC
jgi:hypothetical protein